MSKSHFDRLDAYRLAIEFVSLTRPLVLRLRKTDLPMADQLQRAVISIPCNVAEGAGEFSLGDKARFYRYALRSATECVAVLDASHAIGALTPDAHERMRDVGIRLVKMLTRLVMSATPKKP
ncbi:MAG TPA: four helix bundle protein [Longimicrobiales bacterium]|nr:four helix bundle protein [Longimicrobiales bacterium]